jgi:dUTP pyrophosphatase
MIWIPTRLAPEATLPGYKTDGAAAIDLHAYIPRPRILWPLVPTRIPTGVGMAIPEGHFGLVLGRSGLATRGLCMLGGVIDPDFRGAMQAIVVLLRLWPMVVRPGDRIAQIVFLPYERATLSLHLPMTSTIRGANGLGSTGMQ